MRKPSIRFVEIANDISRINAQREQLINNAFDALEYRHSALAQLLSESLGTRQRAAIWMSSHQRSLAGRTPYEVLAEGDLDTIWDLFDHSSGSTPGESREVPTLAY